MGANVAIWAVRRCRNLELVAVENPEFAVGISTLSVSSRNINVSYSTLFKVVFYEFSQCNKTCYYSAVFGSM